MTPGEDLGPVPEANRPGHHPDVEQDQPPGEAFARRLGLAPAQGEAADDEDADGVATTDGVAADGSPGEGPTPRAPEGAAAARAAAPDPPGRTRAAPRTERTPPVDRRGPVTAALLDGAGPPAGPVTPVEVVAETLELGVRFAIAAALLPARFTAASVRLALRATGRDT
jgi:hypothetical protein